MPKTKSPIRRNKPTFIDLFSGCGGLSAGFVDAGYDLVAGVDNDQAALKTFGKNFGAKKALLADLSKEDYIEDVANLLGGRALDVIVAGPPCQGFSLTGPRRFDDERNRLYLGVFAAVKRFKPRAFLIENVKGMKTLYGGEIVAEIIRRFEKQGYNVARPSILCAADYGVPQIRERLFIVGIRRDVGSFVFPAPTHFPHEYVTCEDAIGDLPSRQDAQGPEIDAYTATPTSDYQVAMRRGAKALINHVATEHTELVKSVIRLVPEGRNHKALPPGVGESRRFNEAWTRYHSKRPSRTIDTGHRNHFHYKWDRVPTVRENARLQSFKDKFVFVGTRTQQNRQVGNAVPPLLAKALGKEIKRVIST
jgi:DNA (cytosine-5)-methyltransferase 1